MPYDTLMSNATATNAVPVHHADTVDGVRWFMTEVADLNYDAYKKLPNIVKYEGHTYMKMGWNTDTGTVSYRETVRFAVPV
jgi:hypothetical protein